jgi:RNA polymerase sigma factor (sigma-70 family)
MKELIEEHRGMLKFFAQKYCAALNGIFTFEELLHEATVAMWKAWELYDRLEHKRAKFNSYAYAVIRAEMVRYVCAMSQTIYVPRQGTVEARSRLLIPTISLDEAICEGGPDRHEFVAGATDDGGRYEADQIDAVMQVIDRLKPEEAWIIKQRYLQQRSLRDLARELGITAEAVRQREMRAMHRLRNRLYDKPKLREELQAA